MTIISDTLSVRRSLAVFSNTTLGENIYNSGTIILHDSLRGLTSNLFKISSSNKSGAISFRNSKSQVIIGNPGIYFNHLTLDNTGGLTLNQGIKVFGILRIYSGHINLNGNNIYFYDLSPDINLATGTLYNETNSTFITDLQFLKPEGLLHAYSKSYSTLSVLSGLGVDVIKLSGNLYLDRGHHSISSAGKGSIRKFFSVRADDEFRIDFKFKYFELNDLKNTGLKEKELALFSNIIGINIFKLESGTRDTIRNFVYQTNLNTNRIYTLSSEICPDPPNVNLGADTQNICIGSVLSLNATGMGISRTWYDSKGVALDTSSIFKISCNVDGFKKILIKVYDNRGCLNKDSVIIATRPYPVASFSLPSFCCEKDSIRAINNSYIYSGPYSSKWILNKIDTFLVKNLQLGATHIGKNEIFLKCESSFGCHSEITKYIVVNPLPVSSFECKDLCNNRTMLFINNSIVPQAGAIIQSIWKIDRFLVDSFKLPGSLNPLQYRFQSAGMKSVELEVMSNAGCKSSLHQVVSVFDPIKPEFEITDHCFGDSSRFMNKSQGSKGPLNFVWNFGDSSNSNASNPSHFYNVPGSYLVTLHISSANNCEDSVQKIVRVFPIPSANFTHELACEKDTLQFSYSGNDSVRCDWSSMGINQDGRNPVYQFPDTGFYKVALKVKSNHGCLDSVEKAIYINPLPSASFEMHDYCLNDSINIVPLYSVNTEKYLWKHNKLPVSENPSLHLLTSLSCKENILELWMQSENGCTSSILKNFRVFELPQLELPSEIKTCGDHYWLNAGNEGSEYSWSDSSGMQQLLVNKSGTYSVKVMNPDGCINSDSCRVTLNSIVQPELGDTLKACDSLILHSSFPDAEVIWSTGSRDEFIRVRKSGVYSVKVRDQNLCEGFDTVFIRIFQSPVINLGNDQLICGDSIIQLGNYTEGLTYFWTDSISGPFHAVSQTGRYSCTATDTNGCKARDSVHVIFEELPVSTLPEAIKACNNVLLDLAEEKYRYAWDNGFRGTQIDFNRSGNYAFRLFGNHCEARDSINVTIYPLPQLDLGEDKYFCQGEGIFLSPSCIQDGVQYLWNTGINSPSIRVQQEGFYSIIAIDINGCSRTDSVYIGQKQNPVIKLEDQYWLCRADSILLDAGKGFSSYSWTSNSKLISRDEFFWISEPGIVDLIIYNKDGCRAEKEIAVNEAVNPVYASFLCASEASAGDSIVFINLSHPEPFSSFWNFTDGLESIESDPVHVYYLANHYNPLLRVNNTYCDDYEKKNVLIRPLQKSQKMNDLKQEERSGQEIEFLIFPNPASELINIRFSVGRKDEWNVLILNSQGILLFSKQVAFEGTGVLSFSINNYPVGLYFVVFQNSLCRKTYRFMVIR